MDKFSFARQLALPQSQTKDFMTALLAGQRMLDDINDEATANQR